MPFLSESYREMNLHLHAERPSYGASGHKWADEIRKSGHTNILDYGCGKGTLKKSLGFEITEYDPCVKGKDSEPVPHECVVCTDVLEHVEPDYLNHVLKHIHDLTKEEAFLVIATRKANKTLPDGRNAHLIVEDMMWWLPKIEAFFVIVYCGPGKQEGEFCAWVVPWHIWRQQTSSPST